MARVRKRIRAWDLAATVGGGDFTAGVKMSQTEEGIFYVEDVVRGQWSPFERDQVIVQTATLDGPSVIIWIEEEPGSSGKSVSAALIKLLAGWIVHAERMTGDKVVRAQPMAAQAEARNIKLVKGPWNRIFLDELHGFPDAAHDDQVDAATLAFNKLAGKGKRVFESEGNEVRRQQAAAEQPQRQERRPIYEEIVIPHASPEETRKAQEGWTFDQIMRRR